MPNVQIVEKGCRGCTLCAEICPVDVFEIDDATELAQVINSDDCIGCLSCVYACPSKCISVSDVQLIRPFHRIENHVSLMEQFLCVQSATKNLTTEEIANAYNEIGILLSAFSFVIGEILGRGHKTVGRRAGTLAAIHLPEMHEIAGIKELIDCMYHRFGSGFNFNCQLEEKGNVNLSTKPCGLLQAVLTANEQPGESSLCLLYHEYWAGLISSFAGIPYTYNLLKAGEECILKLEPSN